MRFSRKIAKYKNLKRITFHGLRHTHASILIEANENDKVVSERLGHNSIVTTINTYTHIDQKRHRQTAKLLDKLL